MKKYLLVVFFFVFSCCLIAQENGDFEDYLSHFKEIELPYDISLDLDWIIFPLSGVIPQDYIHKYVCDPGKPCDDNPLIYNYLYGFQIKLGDYVGVILSKDCTDGDCATKFGIGSVRYLLIVYTSEGQQVSQIILSLASDQHFGYGSFAESDNPCDLLSISIRQAVLHEFLDYRKSIFQGELDYYTYTIDRDGKIKIDKTNSSNIRVQSRNRKFHILEEWE